MFLTLRITPEFCGEPTLAHPRYFVKDIVEYLEKSGEVEHYAWCYEIKNKFGEDTHPHYHLNIECYLDDFNKQSFQAWFRRRPFLPKGNKCYSINICGDPEDDLRWWRYLLKERPFDVSLVTGDSPSPVYLKNLPPHFVEVLEVQWRCAYDERILQIAKNVETRERLLQNDSFRLRCYSAVQTELLGTLVNNKSIFCAIIRYYMDKNKVPPFTTCMNMVYDYKCHFELMTPEEYFDVRYNTDN